MLLIARRAVHCSVRSEDQEPENIPDTLARGQQDNKGPLSKLRVNEETECVANSQRESMNKLRYKEAGANCLCIFNSLNHNSFGI